MITGTHKAETIAHPRVVGKGGGVRKNGAFTMGC